MFSQERRDLFFSIPLSKLHCLQQQPVSQRISSWTMPPLSRSTPQNFDPFSNPSLQIHQIQKMPKKVQLCFMGSGANTDNGVKSPQILHGSFPLKAGVQPHLLTNPLPLHQRCYQMRPASTHRAASVCSGFGSHQSKPISRPS